jgi:hypothetical protein
VPVSDGESISTPNLSVAQEFSPVIFHAFFIHIISTDHGQFSAGDERYPRNSSQPFHRSPGVTREIPE